MRRVTKQKAWAVGCDDFLVKPHSPRQLPAKIRQLWPESDVL
jgi:DNA-binding response OmpR family regulator